MEDKDDYCDGGLIFGIINMLLIYVIIGGVVWSMIKWFST